MSCISLLLSALHVLSLIEWTLAITQKEPLLFPELEFFFYWYLEKKFEPCKLTEPMAREEKQQYVHDMPMSVQCGLCNP